MKIPAHIEEILPDRWMVKRIEHSKNEMAWWIAANPRRAEGKIFAKAEWEAAVEYAREQATAQNLGSPDVEER